MAWYGKHGHLPTGRLSIAIMALIVLLLAFPAAIGDTTVSQRLTSFPPEFDLFLNTIRATTPAQAGFLIVDPAMDPDQHLYSRARYVLYPRQVDVMASGTSPTSPSLSARAITWPLILAGAQHVHARYLIVWARPAASAGDVWNWSLPAPPSGSLAEGSVVRHDGWGILVDVGRQR